jgi:hypothetical protein
MNKILIILISLVILQSCQKTKTEYLKENRFDLTSSNFDFPQKDFRIIGFGAYHGSAKTEQAEYSLLKSLTKNGDIKYYLPETDYSTGYFFEKYLKTGDTLLLKDLIIEYGNVAEQEETIEVYKKWKEIKRLNDSLPKENKLTIVGIDNINSYKYTTKHLLEIFNFQNYTEKPFQRIVNIVEMDTTDFAVHYKSYSKVALYNFVKEYEKNPKKYEKDINDKYVFNHIINNLKLTFKDSNREQIIFENYKYLDSLYNFKNKQQFVRFGFFHIEKERENNNPSFFTRLIENNFYERNEVISIIGYLTESRVLWDIIRDEKGSYKSYTTEGGLGIGDYEKEYFRGIENLKNSKNSDITLFRLNKSNTPYNDGIPDLMEIIMIDEESNGIGVKGKSTTDFLDFAILISNSKASIPIQEMK